MLFFVRSYISDVDGKIQKYFKVLDSMSIDYRFVGWDRIGKSKKNEKNILFRRKGYIGRRFKNIFNLLLWNIFIFKTLFKNKEKINVVHAIDMDSALVSFIFCKIFSKNFIFDIYDKYTDTHGISGILKKLIDKIENFLIEKSDICIIADEFRKQQHKITNYNNILIIENVPEPISLISEGVFDIDENNNKIKIGYFGVLEKKHRGIEDILSVVTGRNNLEFHVVGYGPLEEILIKNSEKNIKFYGAFSSEQGLLLMSKMDIILGMYYKTIPNHFYAAPNKYFEHLMLGKAFLTTKGVPPGIKTDNFNTGWTVNEGEEDLKVFFNNLKNKEEIKIKSSNAKKIWESKYKNYYKDVYINLYGELIKKLNLPKV